LHLGSARVDPGEGFGRFGGLAAEAAGQAQHVDQRHAGVQLRVQHHGARRMADRRLAGAPHHARDARELQQQPERDDAERQHHALPAPGAPADEECQRRERPADPRVHA
jgi:hypothetical protein